MRDGLPRAYLRIDPNVDQAYPELRNTFVGLLCSAGRQPERGRYRDRQVVECLHSRTFVRRCFDRGDLTEMEDGRVYLVGWDEWQEGDMTVAERMRRMRDRRRRGVTVPSHRRNAVTTDAGIAKGIAPSYGVGVDADSPPPPTSGGRRKDGTNPRTVGTAPRQNGVAPRDLGTSPRQERAAEKRGGLEALSAVMAAAAGHKP